MLRLVLSSCLSSRSWSGCSILLLALLELVGSALDSLLEDGFPPEDPWEIGEFWPLDCEEEEEEEDLEQNPHILYDPIRSIVNGIPLVIAVL